MKCLRTAAGWAFLGVVLGQASCGEPDARFANGKKRVASSAADNSGDLTDAYLEDTNDQEYAEYTPVDVVNFCNIYPRVTVAETLSFPATDSCDFDNGINLERRNGHIQAVIEQKTQLTVPSNRSVVCGINLTTQSAVLTYDDLLLLTVEDTIVLSSNQSYFSALDTEGDAYIWDFDRVRGMAVDSFTTDPYCLGTTAGDCELPETDTNGVMKVEFFPEDFAAIAAKYSGRDVWNFGLVTTGDNDDNDCMHSDFSLSYQLSYVDVP